MQHGQQHPHDIGNVGVLFQGGLCPSAAAALGQPRARLHEGGQQRRNSGAGAAGGEIGSDKWQRSFQKESRRLKCLRAQLQPRGRGPQRHKERHRGREGRVGAAEAGGAEANHRQPLLETRLRLEPSRSAAQRRDTGAGAPTTAAATAGSGRGGSDGREDGRDHVAQRQQKATPQGSIHQEPTAEGLLGQCLQDLQQRRQISDAAAPQLLKQPLNAVGPHVEELYR
mmetsp:Transcript_79597/g.257919  ORF Transcript_79597/g.257919 Transcript_79597/m.257919 type:complete len:226 (+) Transcript_79597:592-1269(+)